MTIRRLGQRRRKNDRGTAMVEMVIVAPFLALLVAGIFEFGTLWRDDLSVATSTRSAARVVSNLGSDHLADYEALLSLNAGLSTLDGVTIEGVLIYNASASDGEPHSSCFDGAGDPRARTGQCNFYTAADLATIATLDCETACAAFPDGASCSGSAMSRHFCPQTDRQTNQALGLTSVGVWIRVSREYITGMFPGDGVTITDRAVMKVEPK